MLAGTSNRYDALELVRPEAGAILAALGADRPSDPARLILAKDEAALAADLTTNGKRLAFLRADAVGPEVLALTWGGKAPIWYALGNFVFDQTWSEPTMEGITLEMTFRGTTLAQVHIRPHIILDNAQPNFLDPAGAGRVVMGQVFSASRGLLPW